MARCRFALADAARSPLGPRAEVGRPVTLAPLDALPLWVVDPRSKTVTVYRRMLPPVTRGLEETLDATDVVRGFVCQVRSIFG